jgi:hypothetical protein
MFKQPTAVAAKPSEAPADADNILASALAPSLTDVNALHQMFDYLQAAFKNATGPSAQRLAQYALTVFLKACMLSKGAQPNANELLAIARAPIAGGAGLISYADSGIDQMTAVATALAPTMTDVGTVGTYIASVANIPTKTARLRAYLLALKAKQMALRNPVQFTDVDKMPVYSPGTFFAIANLQASTVPATAANSILAYQ